MGFKSRLALCAALALAAVPARAQAEDDWGVKRNPFDPRLVAQWKAELERRPTDEAVLKKLWVLYSRYAKPEKLIGEYEARFQAHETETVALILGNLWLLRPDADKALLYYGKAAALAPADPAPEIRIATLRLAKGEKELARAAYEKALPLVKSPKDKKPVVRALVDLALDANDMDRAKSYFAAYLELAPTDIGARIDFAEALGKHGLHAESLAVYVGAKQFVRDPEQRIELLLRGGVELEALGKDDDAVAAYREGERLAPRTHHLRRELVDHIIANYRKRQDLRALATQYEKDWPAGSRGYFEWEKLAELYEETGEQDRALEAYRKALAAAPGELDTQKRLIALLERAGKDEEVVRQYETLIRVAPGEPRFRIELAERYWKRGDKKRGLALLDEVARGFPDDAGVHAALADLYSRWGEDARALREYETLVRIEPNDESHIVSLGEQHFQRGDKTRAIDIWKRIAGPRTAESYAKLGEVFGEHDLGAEAVEMYQRALQLKPKEPTLWAGLAGVLERQRQDDKAIDAWEKVMELTAGDAKAKAVRHDARTRIIAILHRKRASELPARTNEWVRRFRSRPPDVEAGYRAVESYLRQARFSDAEEILTELLRLDPQDLDARRQLAQVLKNQRKYAEAIAVLKDLAVAEPAMERQYDTEIAELELALYRDDDAIAFAKKALEKAPNDPQALERLAEIYAKRNDYAQAIAAYRKIADLDARNFQVRFALAKLHLREGQNREAAQLYREIIKRASDEEVVRNAARKAIDLEEYLETLGELEKDLAPLAFLGSGKASYRRILVEIYDRYVPPLVARVRNGDEAAVKELARIGEHGLKPLLEALDDTSDPAQTRVAVRVLGYLANKSAAAPLVKMALASSPAAAERPQAVPSVGAAAIEGVDMDLRVEALVAAGRLGDPRTIPQLATLLANREAALREAAAWALGQTRSPKAVDALIAALADAKPTVHALACVGLGRIGERRGLDKAADAMRDPTRSLEARAACAYALGVAKSAAHAAALAEVVGAGNDDVQVMAAWALGRIADARSANPLLAAYWQRKPVVREAILWALARHAGAADVPPPRFDDVTIEGGKIDVRGLLAASLPELPSVPLDPLLVKGHGAELSAAIGDALGADGRRDIVIRVLRDLDAREAGLALGPFTRIDATTAGDRAAVEQTLAAVATAIATRVDALCQHRDAEVRELALSVLAKIGDARAAGRLARALEDETPAVRLAALAAAERYLARGAKSDELTAAVAAHLKSSSWRERAAAASALGKAPAPPTARLVAALADPSGFVREAATRALGNLRRAEVVEPLVTASKDDVPEVRIAAARALAPLADARARGRLAEMATGDPDARVRDAAGRNSTIPAH